MPTLIRTALCTKALAEPQMYSIVGWVERLKILAIKDSGVSVCHHYVFARSGSETQHSQPINHSTKLAAIFPRAIACK